jgi:RimJ/RimL family protein N-acetyltransferase
MLRTPRLTMRPLVPADADALFAVYGDPEVMRFSVAGAAHRSRADTLGWIRDRIEHQANHGFSTWAVRLSDDGEPIGTCGLEFLPDGRVEIGYRLRRDHGRKGYVTEAARAWLDYGFSRLGLGQIVVLIAEANRPSIRVAERSECGLARRKSFMAPGDRAFRANGRRYGR